MIATLCLNPSIDRTVQVENFTQGATNRIVSEERVGGGKGVNVALSLKHLGATVCTTGILGKENGGMILEMLHKEGIETSFVEQVGTVRTNLKILDKASRTITEINEPGEDVTEETIVAVTQRVAEIAQKCDYLVLTGSLPPGCPNSMYRLLMNTAHEKGCKCVLDASGESFDDGIYGKPDLVKPNLEELEQHLGKKLTTLREIRDAAFGIIQRGAKMTVVSMGAAGALATDGTVTYYAPSIQVALHSTVAAGDAMVAGMIKSFCEGAGLKEALRSGAAAATAAISHPLGASFPKSSYDQWLEKIDVNKI